MQIVRTMRRCSIARIAFTVTTLLLAACATKPPAPPAPAAESGPAPLLPCEQVERLELSKSARQLVALCREGGERRFPVALAREPGPKRERDDQRMPEGDYEIAGPARPSRFHRFIPIDYPSPDDAERALADGRIGPEERDAIVGAHRRRRLPPQQTALGGHLGLHGEGPRWQGDLDLDWTNGCIAVSDEAIDWLAVRAPPGTPLRISP